MGAERTSRSTRIMLPEVNKYSFYAQSHEHAQAYKLDTSFFVQDTHSYTEFFDTWTASKGLKLSAAHRDNFRVCMQILLDPIPLAHNVVFPRSTDAAPRIDVEQDFDTGANDSDEAEAMHSIVDSESERSDMNASPVASPQSGTDDTASHTTSIWSMSSRATTPDSLSDGSTRDASLD